MPPAPVAPAVVVSSAVRVSSAPQVRLSDPENVYIPSGNLMGFNGI